MKKQPLTLTTPIKAPVLISFRHDQSKRLHGAFFDHYVVRKITGYDTQIVRDVDVNLSAFQEYIAECQHTLGLGDAVGERIIPADFSGNMDQAGLLFIPGYSHSHQDSARIQYEKKQIANARRCGQPVLAVCAGAWTLWEAYGGSIRNTTDHLYSSMPWIVKSGHVGNNVQVHRIQITAGSLMSAVMAYEGNPSVNSVHWQVVDEQTDPADFQTSAIAIADAGVAPNNRQGHQLAPESGTIEAFETKQGAPVMGIQWHPEAYAVKANTDEVKPHLNLIRWMTKAGDAFMAKRRLLTEFKNQYHPSASSHAFFKVHGMKSEDAISDVTASLSVLVKS